MDKIIAFFVELFSMKVYEFIIMMAHVLPPLIGSYVAIRVLILPLFFPSLSTFR
jgi:hypothetical protein